MGFYEVFTEWASNRKQRNVDRLAKRFEPLFGHWPDYKLRKLISEADLEFERFPTPNRLKQFAMDIGIWEAKAYSKPRGCPLCNYTGYVPVESPKGEIACTCMCEKGKWIQRLSESTAHENGEVYPKTPVRSIIGKEGYKPIWAATCWGCIHWANGVCQKAGKVKDADHPACMEYESEGGLKPKTKQVTLVAQEEGTACEQL